MGLSRPLLRFLLREHRSQPFSGRVLTLGRQCVYATDQQIGDLFRQEQVPRHPLPAGVSPRTNIPQWRGTPNERFTSDVAFFLSLGATEVLALDYSGFEGAEIVADLNRPLPEEWHGKFDVVVDSGTLEHVFHLPQALANVASLLRVGGRVVHLSPANNYVNHGFYQFSPTLFADFYRINRFADVRLFIGEEHNFRSDFAPFSIYAIGEHQPNLMMSQRRLLTLALARKTADSTIDQIPTQGFYEKLLEGPSDRAVKSSPCTTPPNWKRFIPTRWKTWARWCVPGLDPYFRPWRLKRWGKFR